MRVLVILWVFVFGVTSPVCVAQNSSVYSNLCEYLTNRTWINEAEFRKTYYRNDQPVGVSAFKAALQPNGFFYQCLSNTPYGKAYIYSESTGNYWLMAPNEIDSASKKQQEGASDKNRIQLVSADMRRHVIDVLNMGIEGLDNGNIRWVSTNEFTSPLLDWLGRRTGGNIKVKIELFVNNLPNEIHCISSSTNESQEYDITCGYDKPMLPPHEVIIKKNINGSARFYTNIIDNIVFGLRGDAVEGFVPSNFYTASSMPNKQVIESNGLDYVKSDIGMRLLDNSGVGVNVKNGLPIRPLVRFVLVVLVFLPLTVIAYKAVKGKIKQHETNKKETK